MEVLSGMLIQAIKASVGPAMEQRHCRNHHHSAEYRATEGTSVADYFDRFEWTLKLSQIPESWYADYARVHMEQFLKIFDSPQATTRCSKNVGDEKKNKYVHRVKFRNIVQQRGESIAQFVLRQGSADCEYGDFLDRMLVEQMLHGLTARDICAEIIAKNPSTFKEAVDVALALEGTRNIARNINTSAPVSETANKLGYEKPTTKRQGPRNTMNNPQASTSRNTETNGNHQVACNGMSFPQSKM
uniref:Uncharacterized protein n=1 Tax=Anopheles christyi TaxID=43041 RepID=A0A182KDM0_9DIPT